MTLKDILNAVQVLINRHGEKVEVYFDCPNCKQSFKPGIIETKTIHLTAEK